MSTAQAWEPVLRKGSVQKHAYLAVKQSKNSWKYVFYQTDALFWILSLRIREEVKIANLLLQLYFRENRGKHPRMHDYLQSGFENLQFLNNQISAYANAKNVLVPR